jgi:SCY1-like protein 2
MIFSVLNVEQFQRFMSVIRKLSERVEKEHDQFLRDSQRLEDRSATSVNGSSGAQHYSSSVDFESLVGRANGASIKADTTIDSNKSGDDDIWGSIFNSDEVSNFTQSTLYTPLIELSSDFQDTACYSSLLILTI